MHCHTKNTLLETEIKGKNPIYVQVLVVQLYMTLLEKEIKKNIPMIVASKRVIYLEANLTRAEISV